jgi:hypothetical protein
MHHLRMGEMGASGHNIYGYTYQKKVGTAPATLVIHEEEAGVVRRIFELYASGTGQGAICRILEAEHIRTRTGSMAWDQCRITHMLKNTAYAGVRYYNRHTAVKEASRDGKKPKEKSQQRDARCTEWASSIPVRQCCLGRYSGCCNSARDLAVSRSCLRVHL